jgi:hypothetical protein
MRIIAIGILRIKEQEYIAVPVISIVPDIYEKIKRIQCVVDFNSKRNSLCPFPHMTFKRDILLIIPIGIA